MFTSIFGSRRVDRDLSFIGVDMHSHMLPGIDDGAVTIEESLGYFTQMSQWGYKKCICTPHIFSGVHPNTPATILPVYEKIKEALLEANINIEIGVAAEYMVDESLMDLLNSNAPLLTIGDKYVLIEMSYAAPSPFIESVIFKLNIMGYTPILAHPERYGYYHFNVSQYERFIEMGCIFQLNMLSLSGYYGPSVKKTALKLINQGYIKLIGTDLHHHNHVDAIKAFTITKEFYQITKAIQLLNPSL